MGYEVVTYDTIGNERHKAVCELRKLSTCSPTSSGFRDAIAAAIGVSRDGAPYDDSAVARLSSAVAALRRPTFVVGNVAAGQRVAATGPI